eukprot:4507762-Pyramimonas_sp.AAC.1
MALNLVIRIAVQATATGIAVQIDLARWCHRCTNDLLKAGLQLLGNRAESSHLHIGRFLDTLK